MNYSVTVKVLNSRTYLIDVALHFQFVQTLPPSEQLIQRLVLTELQKDIHVFSIFEEVLKAHNIVVME